MVHDGTLHETNSSHLKIGRAPKENDRLRSIHFRSKLLVSGKGWCFSRTLYHPFSTLRRRSRYIVLQFYMFKLNVFLDTVYIYILYVYVQYIYTYSLNVFFLAHVISISSLLCFMNLLFHVLTPANLVVMWIVMQ